MKTTTILANVLFVGSLLTTNVAAWDCYNDGHRGDPALTRYHAQRACAGYNGNAGAFQGWFAPGETKSACVDVIGSRINLQVKNDRSTSGDLRDADCVKEFNALVSACQNGNSWQGGRGDPGFGWWFRADPNNGAC